MNKKLIVVIVDGKVSIKNNLLVIVKVDDKVLSKFLVYSCYCGW